MGAKVVNIVGGDEGGFVDGWWVCPTTVGAADGELVGVKGTAGFREE